MVPVLLQWPFPCGHLDCCNFFCLLMHGLNLGNNVTVFSFLVVGVFVSSLRGVCIQWNLYITKFSVEQTIFFTPVTAKYMKRKVDVTKPRYSEQILLVPWPFFISRFHSNLPLSKCLFILLFASFTES